jgi:hypothetical protein
MVALDVVFSLFSSDCPSPTLITGLSRAPKLRTKVRIGWLAPMFGIFVIMDLTSFWLSAWEIRTIMRVSYESESRCVDRTYQPVWFV